MGSTSWRCASGFAAPSFGRPDRANPDLVLHITTGAELAEAPQDGGDSVGLFRLAGHEWAD
jgi:hypothetical protein